MEIWFTAPVFLLISYAAAATATIAGFGSSTLLIPAAVMFMNVKTAVFIVACFHFFNNIFKIRMFRDSIDFKIFLLFGVPSVISAFIGAALISLLPVDSIKKILGMFLVFFAVYSFIKPAFVLRNTKVNAVLGGGFSGLSAGLIGLGGAIRSAFLIAFKLPKESYVATSAMIAFVVDLTRIPSYLFTKIVDDPSYYALLPFLLVSAYLGVRTGKVFLSKLNREAFRKIVLIIILLAGIKLLF
jgi:uncharacterized protein